MIAHYSMLVAVFLLHTLPHKELEMELFFSWLSNVANIFLLFLVPIIICWFGRNLPERLLCPTEETREKLPTAPTNWLLLIGIAFFLALPTAAFRVYGANAAMKFFWFYAIGAMLYGIILLRKANENLESSAQGKPLE